MDITQLKKDFLSVNGWKQNRNPSGMQITDMLTSDSGLWFNDIHPMLTYSNIECLSDDDSEYVYPAFDAAPMSKSPTAVAEIPLIRRASEFTSTVILSSFTLRVFPDLERASPATI